MELRVDTDAWLIIRHVDMPFVRFLVLANFLSVFFFSRFFSESSDTLRMLPYDCINRRCSLAVIMQEIF